MVEVMVVAELTVLVIVEVKVTLVMVDGEMPMVENNGDGGAGGKEEKQSISFTRCEIVTWQEENAGLPLKTLFYLKAASDTWLTVC